MSCALGVNLLKNIFWTKRGNQSCRAWLWSNLRKWKCCSFLLLSTSCFMKTHSKTDFFGGGSSELQDLKKLKEVKFVNFVSFLIGENLLKNLFWPKYCMIRFVVKIYILISSSRAETAPPGAASDLYHILLQSWTFIQTNFLNFVLFECHKAHAFRIFLYEFLISKVDLASSW